MEFLWYLLIGLVAGWLGNLIMKGSGAGLLINLLVGVVGGILGGWIFSLLGIHTGGGLIWNLVTALVGAVILLWIVSLIMGRKKKA